MKNFLAFLLVMLCASNLCADTSVALVQIGGSATVVHGALIDNFDDGAGGNLWGGANGAFGNTLIEGYDATQTYGGRYALKLDYNVSGADDYCGFFMQLGINGVPADVSQYSYLSFMVKGNLNAKSFKVEMSTATGKSSRVYVADYLDGGVTTGWQEVRIPLSAFFNSASLTGIKEIVFVFENTYMAGNGYSTHGIVYLDNVRFDTGRVAALRIDHFGDSFGVNALGGNMGGMNGTGSTNDVTFEQSVFLPQNQGGHPNGMRSQYNLAANGWAGIWFIFGDGQPRDFTSYTKLTLWARSHSTTVKPRRIKIQLIDSGGEHFALIPDNSTTQNQQLSIEWQKYQINLAAFPFLDEGTIKQMNIVYEYDDVGAAGRAATVYYDNIQFEE